MPNMEYHGEKKGFEQWICGSCGGICDASWNFTGNEEMPCPYCEEAAEESARLLPCPYCGGKAMIRAVGHGYGCDAGYVAGCTGCGKQLPESEDIHTAAWTWNELEGGRSCRTDENQEVINPTAGTPIRLGTFEWVLSRMKFGPSLTWPMFRRKAWPEDEFLGVSDSEDEKGHLAVIRPIYDENEYFQMEIVGYTSDPLTFDDLLAEDWIRDERYGLWEWGVECPGDDEEYRWPPNDTEEPSGPNSWMPERIGME